MSQAKKYLTCSCAHDIKKKNNAVLIQRGGGTDPLKPRQPMWSGSLISLTSRMVIDQ